MRGMVYLTEKSVEVHFDIPLAELILDFFDQLKSRTKGYASLDYEFDVYHQSDLVKLDILLAGEEVDALSFIVHKDKAYDLARGLCDKLRDIIPRQQFEVPIQGAIGNKIISRSTVKAHRKDVLAKCYGGDISRKRKLLEKQKEGKKRMLQAQVVLEGAGLFRYEVASYARPERACRHNITYWTGGTYLGLGTSASSMLSVEGYLILSKACPQLPPPPDGSVRVRLTCTSSRRVVAAGKGLGQMSYDLEFLTARQALAEDLMLGSRLSSGLSEFLVASSRLRIGGEVDQVLEGLVGDGLLDEDLASTQRGWLLGNELYGRLWDLGGAEPVISMSC